MKINLPKLLGIFATIFATLSLCAIAGLVVGDYFESQSTFSRVFHTINFVIVWGWLFASLGLMVCGYFAFALHIRFTNFKLWMFVGAHLTFLFLLIIFLSKLGSARFF